ncbi:NADPH:quinone reductase [Agyrium rufum]|nr:NADPH:quinone reductase [Agyrium rufum]
MATDIPKTMKGIIVPKTGGSDVLEYKTDLPVPVPKEGEVLVKNDYIGINFIDTYFRTGLYPGPLPHIPGRDATGKIVSLGPGTHPASLKEGAEVVYLSAFNTYCEYTAAPSSKTLAVPQGISPANACASILQALTAITMVTESHPVQKGDLVLVHAAAGGVGLWLCKALRVRGAKVLGTVGSEAKKALAEKWGCDVVYVGYDAQGVKEMVEREGGKKIDTEDGGVIAAFDGVGKDTFEGSLAVMARKGTLVSFGNSSGAVEPFRIARLTAKNVKVVRPKLDNYIYTREEFENYAEELWTLMRDQSLDTHIHEIYPLQDAKRAHDDLEGRKSTGKLLLRP